MKLVLTGSLDTDLHRANWRNLQALCCIDAVKKAGKSTCWLVRLGLASFTGYPKRTEEIPGSLELSLDEHSAHKMAFGSNQKPPFVHSSDGL
jgi:hypothetical protein